MLKMDLRVTYPGGRQFEVTTGNPDVIRMERKLNCSVGELAGDLHAEHITFLAWAALRRREPGGVHPDWDEFSETAEVEMKQTAEQLQASVADLEEKREKGDIPRGQYEFQKGELEDALAELDTDELTRGRLGEEEPEPASAAPPG